MLDKDQKLDSTYKALL